ncbi:MAG: hypothetical protein WED09_06890 [Homoserinimonas sp.]
MPRTDDATFRNHAGTVFWPTTPAALTDSTRCPACYTPLVEVSCDSCGLNLAHPAASELASLSQTASEALSRRVEVIGRIRYETAAPPAPAQDPVDLVTAPVVPPIAEPAWQTPRREPASGPTHPLPMANRPRRSGVQVALLVAGVSLLSVFAIFFLVYAFINYGIVWRSIIIAAITLAAFGSASLLRRKALIASAEGLAAFALVLVYLDAYALRANAFFGLGSADSATYWGATIAIASLGFIVWHRLSKVRAASIVGWAGLAIGVGTLIWGLGDEAEPATRAVTGIVAAAVVGLAHILIPRAPFVGTLERMLVLSTTLVALSAAFLVSWVVDPFSDWGGTVAGAIVALIAFLHAGVAAIDRTSTPPTRAFGQVFATVGGVAAAAAVSATAIRVAPEKAEFALVAPVVAAAVVFLALEVGMRRAVNSLYRPPVVFAARGAAAVLILTALPPLATALAPIGMGLVDAMASPWGAGAAAGLAGADSTSDFAVLALGSVVAIAAVVWLLTRGLRQRAPALAWGAGVVLIPAAAQLPSIWLTLAGWLLLSVVAFLLLRTTRAAAYRACLVTVLAIATTLMFSLGWASPDTWAGTTVATIALLLACRAITHTAASRAALLGACTVLIFVGAAAAARHLLWPEPLPSSIERLNASVLVTLVGSVLVALAAVGYPRAITVLDRRTVFWIAGLASGAAAVATVNVVTQLAAYDQSGLLLPQPITSLAASVLLVGALLLWVGLPSHASLRLERIAASVAVSPVVLWVVDSFARVLDLSDFAQSVVPITAALLTAVGALAVTLLRPTGTPRLAREAGVALVGIPALVTAVVTDAASGWLVLILGAVTVLLIAVGSDGLFASRSTRRHLGWLALVLATAGLWWRLSSDRVSVLELYVLPLAAALLLVAYLIHRAASRAETPVASRAAPFVVLCGLLIGILPSAANSITGDTMRPLVVFAVSAVLLLIGCVVARHSVQPYLDVIALAGLAGVLATAGGRALLAPNHNLVPDTWMAAALAVLLVAAVGQARQRNDANPRTRTMLSQVLVGTGLAIFAGIEAVGFSDTTLGIVRAIATVALLCAFHVVAFTVDRAPFTRAVAVFGIALAAAVAVAGVSTGALDPIELGTVPLAIALLATGRIRLAAEPGSRSWRTLAPAIIVILVPSLLATISEPELWRLVGLGVVSVTVLIVGAVRRLQAPFILGLVIALIHGFATFAPQVRAVYESQEWWLWAGLAGIVLVVVAIRYEKRIQSLKDAVGRIAALR